jgi:hypothetical protein
MVIQRWYEEEEVFEDVEPTGPGGYYTYHDLEGIPPHRVANAHRRGEKIEPSEFTQRREILAALHSIDSTMKSLLADQQAVSGLLEGLVDGDKKSTDSYYNSKLIQAALAQRESDS